MNLHVKVAIIIAIYLCGVFCHREIDEFRLNMLIFHFGKWGDDFRYWCHFVKFTPEITYTVISDATSFEPYENHVPSNVRLLTTSLDNIKDAAIKILDIKNETKPLLNSPCLVRYLKMRWKSIQDGQWATTARPTLTLGGWILTLFWVIFWTRVSFQGAIICI